MNSRANQPDLLQPESLDALHRILEEELCQYERAVQTLGRKQEILVSGKPQLLGQIDRELQTLVQKASQLEKQRQVLMTQMGFDGVRLEAMISNMDKSNARRFGKTRQRLLRAMQDTQRLNGNNRDLLGITLHWLRDTVELIANALTPEGASYDAQGGKTRRKQAETPIQSTVNHSA